jgi:acetoin utilization deacetylase AcuC-like enzyme
MLPFKLIYSDGYYLPIGEHVFPAEKYRRIRDRLLASGLAGAGDFLEPEPATDQEILLVHTPEYVHKLKTGTLSPREEMELEVPFSPELVKAFWLAAGDRFWRRGRLWRTVSPSTLAADFIMHFPTTVKASA